ncbi:sugar O-acetyltransferase [Agarivorans albus]
MSEFENMCLGKEYDADSPELAQIRNKAFELLQQINQRQFEAAKPYVAELLAHLGKGSIICPNSQFYTPTHPLDYQRRRTWEVTSLPITVEDDVWIGGNVVCQGVTIGARSVVAAGSVVTKNVEPDSLVGGMPAKRIRALV